MWISCVTWWTAGPPAVIVGAGFIGLESAEALRHRGLAVTLVELAGQVLPALDPEMARSIELELLRAGVRCGWHLGHRAAGGGRRHRRRRSLRRLPGPRRPGAARRRGPAETSLAAAAGLALGARGALLVDEHLRTSVPSIYGVGDAIQVTDAVTGGPAWCRWPAASRQGRAAADHLFGRGGRRSPVLGTAIVRVFGTVAATTGTGEKALRAAGIPHHAVHLHPDSHAGYYPRPPAAPETALHPGGRILGAQATGADGVDKRIDVIATAIRAGLTVDDLAGLDLAYSRRSDQPKTRSTWPHGGRQLLTGTLALWRPATCSTPTAGSTAGRPVRRRVRLRPPARRAEHPAHRAAPAAREIPRTAPCWCTARRASGPTSRSGCCANAAGPTSARCPAA